MANKKDNLKAYVVKKVVDKLTRSGDDKLPKSEETVYKVIAGDRENEIVLDEYFELKTRIEREVEDYMNTPLMAAVNELVPFN